MEATGSSETLVPVYQNKRRLIQSYFEGGGRKYFPLFLPIYQTTRHHIPEHHNFNLEGCAEDVFVDTC
jgi:hypothetical protein